MSAAVDVLAVVEAAPSVNVCGVTVVHNTSSWRVATNRHPEIGGQRWGWIEGAPGNVCWSNAKTFNEKAAGELVAAHSKWLEDQKPLSIRLVEARERFNKAKSAYDSALLKYTKAKATLEGCAVVIADLSSEGGAA